MDEDIFEAIKKQQEFDRMFPNYPCKMCMKRTRCETGVCAKQCPRWLDWFNAEWRRIRSKFGK